MYVHQIIPYDVLGYQNIPWISVFLIECHIICLVFDSEQCLFIKIAAFFLAILYTTLDLLLIPRDPKIDRDFAKVASTQQGWPVAQIRSYEHENLIREFLSSGAVIFLHNCQPWIAFRKFGVNSLAPHILEWKSEFFSMRMLLLLLIRL